MIKFLGLVVYEICVCLIIILYAIHMYVFVAGYSKPRPSHAPRYTFAFIIFVRNCLKEDIRQYINFIKFKTF